MKHFVGLVFVCTMVFGFAAIFTWIVRASVGEMMDFETYAAGAICGVLTMIVCVVAVAIACEADSS